MKFFPKFLLSTACVWTLSTATSAATATHVDTSSTDDAFTTALKAVAAAQGIQGPAGDAFATELKAAAASHGVNITDDAFTTETHVDTSSTDDAFITALKAVAAAQGVPRSATGAFATELKGVAAAHSVNIKDDAFTTELKAVAAALGVTISTDDAFATDLKGVAAAYGVTISNGEAPLTVILQKAAAGENSEALFRILSKVKGPPSTESPTEITASLVNLIQKLKRVYTPDLDFDALLPLTNTSTLDETLDELILYFENPSVMVSNETDELSSLRVLNLEATNSLGTLKAELDEEIAELQRLVKKDLAPLRQEVTTAEAALTALYTDARLKPEVQSTAKDATFTALKNDVATVIHDIQTNTNILVAKKVALAAAENTAKILSAQIAKLQQLLNTV